MELRPIRDGYSVSSHLVAEDMAVLAAAGVKTVICNRPDTEVAAEVQSGPLRDAAEKAGMAFVYIPVVGIGMSPDAIERQAKAIDGTDGQVVGYCASGMRSALMWALANAGREPTEGLLKAISEAGYQLDHLAGQIDGVGQMRGQRA